MHEPLVALELLDGAVAPEYQTPGSAGADLRAALNEPFTLAPGQRAIVPTGLRMRLPDGFEAQVRSRSGLAAKHGVVCLNAPGTIDSDYRGEVKVILQNHGQEPYSVRPGDRIAQLIVSPVCRARFVVTHDVVVDDVGNDDVGNDDVGNDDRATAAHGSALGQGARERGDGGFGSTGR